MVSINASRLWIHISNCLNVFTFPELEILNACGFCDHQIKSSVFHNIFPSGCERLCQLLVGIN